MLPCRNIACTHRADVLVLDSIIKMKSFPVLKRSRAQIPPCVVYTVVIYRKITSGMQQIKKNRALAATNQVHLNQKAGAHASSTFARFLQTDASSGGIVHSAAVYCRPILERVDVCLCRSCSTCRASSCCCCADRFWRPAASCILSCFSRSSSSLSSSFISRRVGGRFSMVRR